MATMLTENLKVEHVEVREERGLGEGGGGEKVRAMRCGAMRCGAVRSGRARWVAVAGGVPAGSHGRGVLSSPGAERTIESPSYGLMPAPARSGTEPGTLASARNAMMPICARRPLLISAMRPLAFFSGEAFFERLNGSKRLSGTGCGIWEGVGG